MALNKDVEKVIEKGKFSGGGGMEMEGVDYGSAPPTVPDPGDDR
jgi:hypothetical protein